MNLLERVVNSFVSLIFRTWPQKRPDNVTIQNLRLVAHRGVHETGARENSRESFQLAIDHKIWAIEFDVRFTRDHIPVIIHDPTCQRIFNRPDLVIGECVFETLNQQVALFSLADVVNEFGKKIHLMIELKEDINGQPEKIRNFLDAIAPLTPIEDYHLLSLTPQFLEGIPRVPREACLDVIWLDSRSVFRANDQLNHGAVAGHFLFFSKQKIAELKSKKKQVGVGFIDSKNSLFRELNRGADMIFTNHPLRLISSIK